MAIDINDYKLPITAGEARVILQKATDNMGIFIDLDRIMELIAILKMEVTKTTKSACRIIGMPHVDLGDKKVVISILLSLGASQEDLTVRSSKSLSTGQLAIAAIRQNPNSSEALLRFVDCLEKYTKCTYTISILRTYTTKPLSMSLTYNKHRMIVCHPEWFVQSTSRLGSREPNIQGLGRNIGDIITQPPGYTLVRCDSGQIEPRINFSTFIRDDLIVNLIKYYDDAYYGMLHFCTMSIDEEKAFRADFENNFVPMEITKAIEDERQSIKTLTNAGSYGSTNLGNINPTLSKAFENRIVRHPARLELERKVREQVERGVETFYGMFGTPVTPDETSKYKKGDKGWQNHLIRCGINNPVQTTASELMMFSINEATKILSEAKNSHICYYKHDEAAFLVSDEDAANGFIERLKDVTAYNVKGWIPIHADSKVGVKKPVYPSYL